MCFAFGLLHVWTSKEKQRNYYFQYSNMVSLWETHLTREFLIHLHDNMIFLCDLNGEYEILWENIFFFHHHHINGSHCMLTCMCFKLPFTDLSHPPKVQANKSSSLPTSLYNITYCRHFQRYITYIYIYSATTVNSWCNMHPVVLFYQLFIHLIIITTHHNKTWTYFAVFMVSVKMLPAL